MSSTFPSSPSSPPLTIPFRHAPPAHGVSSAFATVAQAPVCACESICGEVHTQQLHNSADAPRHSRGHNHQQLTWGLHEDDIWHSVGTHSTLLQRVLSHSPLTHMPPAHATPETAA